MKKVLLVDDQNIVALGIAKLLEISGKIEVIDQLNSGADCLEYLATRLQPDVVLLDVHMEKMNGLEVLKKIRTEWSIPVIFLTTFDDEYLKHQAIEAGANGLLLKNIGLNDLIDSILKVASGKTLFSAKQLSNLNKMTERENCIARSLVEGKTAKQSQRKKAKARVRIKNTFLTYLRSWAYVIVWKPW